MNKLILAFSILFFISCDKDSFSGTENEQIEQYITSKSLVVNEKTADGLRVIYETQNNGAMPKVGQTVNLNYAGYLLNGKKFDSGNFNFVLGAGSVIGGFDKGVAKSRVGQKTKLIFPSNLGYGAGGTSGIPGNSPLIFDIEVLSIK